MSTATGSRPANGSSSTRSFGSCTSAAASCARCWLPCESSSTCRAGPILQAEPLEPARCRGARPARVQPVQASEVLDLLPDLHPWVEAALLRHVAELEPLGQAYRPPVPEHLPGVQLHELEDAAHRRGLAGSVRAQEPDHAAGLHREAQPVERDDLVEALPEVDQLEAANVRARRRRSAACLGREPPSWGTSVRSVRHRKHGYPLLGSLTRYCCDPRTEHAAGRGRRHREIARTACGSLLIREAAPALSWTSIQKIPSRVSAGSQRCGAEWLAGRQPNRRENA